MRAPKHEPVQSASESYDLLGDTSPTASTAIRAAQDEYAATAADAAAVRADRQKLKTRETDTRARHASLQRSIDKASADAVLIGGDVPDCSADERALARLAATLKAFPAAIGEVEIKLNAAEAALALARKKLSAANLSVLMQRKDHAAERLKQALSTAVDATVELIALQRTQDQIIGDAFIISGTTRPDVWNSEVVAGKFYKALPTRIRPDGLSDAAIDMLIKSRVERVTRSIQEI